jgi:hypothetical protein
MKSLKRTTARGLAAGLAGALVAGAASILAAAPAQAVPAVGDLTWNVSGTFANFGYSQLDGVTFDSESKQFSFPATDVEPGPGGTAIASFSGSAEKGFTNPGTGAFMYSITIEDPKVIVEPDGDGRIEATVHSTGSNTDPTAETTPTEVTVVEFTGATLGENVVSGTPNWENVLAPGSERAIELGISNIERPVGGRSFHPDFLGAIHNDVRAHFYWSTGSETKRPGDFTATVTEAPAVTAVLNAARDSVAVTGTNFLGGDANRKGVYVGIAESGGLPDTGSIEDQAKFVGAELVWDANITDGAFSRNVSIETDKVKPGVEYSVYTWQAHIHSSAQLDTETPIGVLKDVAATKKATKTNFAFNKKANRKKAGKVTVTVKSGQAKPQGKVQATIKVPGVKKAKKVTKKLNKNSKVAFKLPKAKKKGQYKVTVKYLGNKNFKVSKKVKKYKVKK